MAWDDKNAWGASGDKNFNAAWNPSWAGFDEATIKRKLLIHEAKRWIGITEEGAANHGQMVERFQKAVDGKSSGEPWCMAFVQFCLEAVDSEFAACFSPEQSSSKIFKSEHVLTTFNNSPSQQIAEAEPGSIVCWQMWNGDRATTSGHTGIVVEVLSGNIIRTVEGNTKDKDAKIEREGDGVFLRERFVSFQGPMRVKGFLRPW
jgi:hypothetical protein